MASVLHFICAFFVYHMLQSTYQLSTNQLKTCYPNGSVACKLWNKTTMDCTRRYLVCIPPLQYGASIESLDLSFNRLGLIPANAFYNLKKLQHMRLKYSHISSLKDGAFNRLHKLLTLDLFANSISNLQAGVFNNLNNLQMLNIDLNHISVVDENAFDGLLNLLTLSLYSNDISFISNKTFNSLSKLTTIDLNYNHISVISDVTFHSQSRLNRLELQGNPLVSLHGFPFHSLTSLQTLTLHHNLSNLHATSFTGLENLQDLQLSFPDGSDNMTDTPLRLLSSLKTLYIYDYVYNCNTFGKLFIGLHNLQFLHINVGGYCPDIVFCSSYKGHSIYKNGSHTCSKNVPLKSLRFDRESAYSTSLPAFNALHNLTNLELDNVKMSEAIDSLNGLKSPLQNLTMSDWEGDLLVSINSSTFASWGAWKASLQLLSLSVHEIWLDGSPFKWFTDLKELSIDVFQVTKLTLSANTFEGLTSLQKLTLDTFTIPASVFSVLSSYNTLTTLHLAQNHLSGEIDELWEQLCTISTLENIDLSWTHIDASLFTFPHLSCSQQSLKKLSIANQKGNIVYSQKIFELTPQLESLDARALWIIFEYNCTGPRLLNLILSESYMEYDDIEMNFPLLKVLALSKLNTQYTTPDFPGLLKIFKAPKLEWLDLSQNDITNINNDLHMYIGNLSNLVHLDLAYNKLTSLSNFHHLRKMTEMWFDNNLITVVPKEVLQQSNHPSMSELDLSNNPFQCDCNVEAFRNWILSDDTVHLKGVRSYKCSSPDSQKGFSITQVILDCKIPIWKYALSGATCAIVLLITIILMVHYRWHIKYRFFLLLNRRRPQQHFLLDNINCIDDDETGILQYDAYVPYHIDDEDWVDEVLLPNIEEGEEPFRLCLRRRDIRAGRPIFNELSLHIQRSRKILVILSPRFVEDNWCYFELNMAHHRVLEENRNVMIIIILEEVPDDKMTLLLRQLFCRVEYLKWPADEHGQNLFWRRLREEMKRPVPLDRRFDV